MYKRQTDIHALKIFVDYSSAVSIKLLLFSFSRYIIQTSQFYLCREFFSEYATGVMIQHKMKPDELEYLLDISGRTPYWICRQLFCDAVFSNYLETAKDVGTTLPSLMFIAEHWQDIAKPFVEAQLPGYDTYVMGGHLMFYEYPEKWNRVLEDFLNKL